jgi:hypothetical protein
MAIALMMEAASTSETSVSFYQTTRSYNPEDSHLQFLKEHDTDRRKAILVGAQIGIGRGRSSGGSLLDEMREVVVWGFIERQGDVGTRERNDGKCDQCPEKKEEMEIKTRGRIME